MIDHYFTLPSVDVLLLLLTAAVHQLVGSPLDSESFCTLMKRQVTC